MADERDTPDTSAAPLSAGELAALLDEAVDDYGDRRIILATLAARDAEIADWKRDYALLRDEVAGPEITRLESEVAALRAQVAGMREIVAAVADAGATVMWDEGIRLFCCSACGRQWSATDIDEAIAGMVHKPGCPVTRARALLATSQPGAAGPRQQEGE